MIQLGKLKPEYLQEKMNALSYCSREELIERYVEVQHQLIYESALGDWLNALADAFRDNDDDAWQEEQIAKEIMIKKRKEIESKYE